jgi:hypothetical protein
VQLGDACSIAHKRANHSAMANELPAPQAIESMSPEEIEHLNAVMACDDNHARDEATIRASLKYMMFLNQNKKELEI